MPPQQKQVFLTLHPFRNTNFTLNIFYISPPPQGISNALEIFWKYTTRDVICPNQNLKGIWYYFMKPFQCTQLYCNNMPNWCVNLLEKYPHSLNLLTSSSKCLSGDRRVCLFLPALLSNLFTTRSRNSWTIFMSPLSANEIPRKTKCFCRVGEDAKISFSWLRTLRKILFAGQILYHHYLLGNHSPLWQVLGCNPIDSCLAFLSVQQLSLCWMWSYWTEVSGRALSRVA